MSTVLRQRGSALITGRKFAVSRPEAARSAYRLDPREGVREIVAQLASDHNREELMALAEVLRERLNEGSLRGGLQGTLYRLLAKSSNQSIAVPIPVTRIPSPAHNGYPLRRSYLITVNRELDEVVAEIRELNPIISLRGRGADVESAFDSLARLFDRVVRENHFVPPHARMPANDRIDAILNHMVDWERYEQENPVIQPLWGRIKRRSTRGLSIFWLIGPAGARDVAGILPVKDVPDALGRMSKGQWFYGTAKCYTDRIEWEEEPHAVPDPHDHEARRSLWESIPKVPADEPGCWPLKAT